ncbi:MAG: hypothetical protein JWQ79_3159 [Mucilaginibacter sp.]|nr:hypothetical protein [Mucilaginibacter sp.]
MSLNQVKNVSLLPFALSNVSSAEDFKITRNSWNQGTFNLNHSDTGEETQKVFIRVADDLDELKNLTRLDLVKIDVEGFEYRVLKGLFNTLYRFRPRIIFEFDHNYWLKSGNDIAACYNLLQSLHYALYQITSVGCEYIHSLNDIKNGNIFCIQENSESQ